MIDKAKIEEWKAHTAALEHGERAIDQRMQHDGECDHGMWWRDCPNEPCAEKDWQRGDVLAVEAVPALLSEREGLIALLKEIEWKGVHCPSCGGLNPDAPRRNGISAEGMEHLLGHKPDCRLSAALRGTP
jgi:hypothetical protein